MNIVAYAIAMLFIFPLGTPMLYAFLLFANREQLERIRRAEVTAEAEKTKFKQRKRSVDLRESARGSSRRSESARESESRWKARASDTMQAMVDSENTQRDQAQRLRAQLTPAVQQLTDGCL
jgi:hypothetical protein